MVDEHVLNLPCRYYGVSTTRLRGQGLLLYPHFDKPSNRQTSQEERSSSTNITLQLMYLQK